jgi:cytolysin (calcineurin-like family phosphatase)
MTSGIRRGCRALTTGVDDRGGIVLGWLTRLTVFLAVGGVFLFDAISLGSTKATLADQASFAARSASETWQQTKNVQRTFAEAERAAAEQNAGNHVLVRGFQIDQDGTVHLVLRREASTLVLYRWSKTRAWAKIRAEGEGLGVS